MSPEAARVISAGIAALALYGIGMSMGNVFTTWISSIARNPEADQKMRQAGMLGFALVESIAIFILLIVFMILR
jgi:F-type H+-transporting ATPase subunit c